MYPLFSIGYEDKFFSYPFQRTYQSHVT